jgi:hypothetical protein
MRERMADSGTVTVGIAVVVGVVVGGVNCWRNSSLNNLLLLYEMMQVVQCVLYVVCQR